MKVLFIGLISLTSALAFASTPQISHKTCNLWIPTWKPQGHLYVDKAELESRKLQSKGYHVRFGMTRSDHSDDELFLEVREDLLRSSNLVRSGKANLTLVIQDLNPAADAKELYVDESSIQCSFRHSVDPASYKDYTKACTSELVSQFSNLPECVKL